MRGGRMSLFSPDFLWGTSQSGHQIEGENFASDWWRWEQRTGHIANGDTSKVGADFLNRSVKDLALARDFGHNAFLFSVEWSRVEPEPGRFDDAAITFYRTLAETARGVGLEPVCVLHHVTQPRWFAEELGWHCTEAVDRFLRYARRIVPELAPNCRWWAPIREPMHRITMAHLLARWPRTTRSLNKARYGLIHQGRAHAETYRLIHETRSDARVGAMIHTRRFRPLDEFSPWDTRAALREERRCNRLWLNALTTGEWPMAWRRDDSVRNSIDFIGVAYYGRETVRFSLLRPQSLFARLTDEEGIKRDVSAYVQDAEGLVEILRQLSDYDLPLIVHANGMGTNDDRDRCAYLLEHARALRVARNEGINLQGYLHRSLLDGFEWDRGYTDRYGLFHVDRDTLSRTPNPSAFLYKELCRTGDISEGAIRHYAPQLIRNREAATA